VLSSCGIVQSTLNHFEALKDIMCKETLPEIPFSNVKCTIRPKTSFAPTPAGHHRHLLIEQDMEPPDFAKLKRQDSNGRISHEISPKKMNYVVDETTLPLDHCSVQMRPKTVRVSCNERTACSPGILTITPQNEQLRTFSKEHKKREVVVFLPSPANCSNNYPQTHISQGLPSHLPEIGSSETRTLSHFSEESGSLRRKTNVEEYDDISPLPCKLAHLKHLRHSVGLPVISSPRPDRKPLRRAKSDDLEKHLKQAEKDYDKHEAKAFLVFNWMKAQNGQSETTSEHY